MSVMLCYTADVMYMIVILYLFSVLFITVDYLT